MNDFTQNKVQETPPLESARCRAPAAMETDVSRSIAVAAGLAQQFAELDLFQRLAGVAGWITGIRADQSANRAGLSFASFDAQRDLIKVNPLFDWTREQAAEFVQAHRVPYNALHGRGFLSIGCAPCTRAIAPGEP